MREFQEAGTTPAMLPILAVAVQGEIDVLAARQRARQLAALCGFGTLDQARIATTVSELARNIINYAIAGMVRFSVGGDAHSQALAIVVADDGPGIADLELILGGGYRSTTGMGLGILAARRLMDRCDIVTGPGQGTRITIGKTIPGASGPMTPAAIADIVARLDTLPDNMALSESRQQNRDLGDALAALQARQEESLRLTARLEETNARVEALNVMLDEKARALQGADRRKDEFVAILSHELRSPLSAAGVAAQLLASSPVTAERTAKMSQLIVRQVDHMTRLVEDLLDVSRVSRGLVTIERAPVDLGEVVLQAVEQVAAYGREKRHDIVATVPPAPCLIEGDKTRLVQVVSNLLSNAIRYTPAGGAISVALTAGAGVISLRVADNGIGLAPELMPQLFDLYVQAERSSVREGGGLGLGLALVKSLVEAHHGTVTARSDGVGAGSTFSVMFPTPAAVPTEPQAERRRADLPS